VNRRLVAIVAFPGVQALDVAGPHEVFAGARTPAGERAYDVRVVAASPGPVASESGLTLLAEPWASLDGLAIDTVVVPGGSATRAMDGDTAEVRWLASVAPGARRLATVCTGAFVGAMAGLLDGRRVATHWRYAARLAREHPALQVDADAIFVRDGSCWTSAGVTAGIDLALAIVEEDCGVAMAQAIARQLVMFVRRPGGQSQFAAPTWTERAEAGPVRTAQELVDAEPGADHRVPVLARTVGMSERHFTRRFAREVGLSPARYVERVRIDTARRLLERGDGTVDVVARACGFGTAETMRRAFHRVLGVAPDDYRRRFAPRPS